MRLPKNASRSVWMSYDSFIHSPVCMKISSILGKLPASRSPAGELDGLDYAKIARLALVTFISAAAISFSQVDIHATASSWEQLQAVLFVGLQAGFTALGAAAVEAARRFFTNQAG